MRAYIIPILICLFLIAVPVSCILYENVVSAKYGEGSVIFIEHLSHVRGKLINGDYPYKSLGQGEYVFNAETGRITCDRTPVMNNSMKVLLGKGKSLIQDAGDGFSNTLLGLYSLPSEDDGIRVDEVMQNGTIRLNYKGEEIMLSKGERWEDINTTILETSGYKIRLVVSDSIRNNGFISMDNIGQK